ncbi:MAG: hypothetical protein EZS28_038796 [Streblomastix strix]|uniref:Uncharacterized protein n=1 Tax=Streblomastix strix TaxID=222440 RepID=A0A5J4U4I0_9EUKA|nr:MAG: hypothetical protein EZS28_038796 [Streblomastix strix]
MEWLDSLTYTAKYINQYPKQQQAQLRLQHNKSQNQKQKAKTKNNQQIKQSESQLMEQTIMKTTINLSTQSNPSTSLTETMDSERMTAGRSYRPLSTEKRIPRSISQNIRQHSTSQCKRIRWTRRKRLRDAVTGSNQRKWT